MPHHAMTPRVSGTSLSAQARYATGVREILECWFEGRSVHEEYPIVANHVLLALAAAPAGEGCSQRASPELSPRCARVVHRLQPVQVTTPTETAATFLRPIQRAL